MEPETQKEALMNSSREVGIGMTGKTIDTTPTTSEGPLDELRRLTKRNEELNSSMDSKLLQMQRIEAELILSGKSRGGKPVELSDSEIKKMEVDKRAAMLVNAFK